MTHDKDAPLREDIVRLTDFQLDTSKREYEAAQTRYAVVQAVSIGLTAVGIGLAILLGIALIRGIQSSLKRAVSRSCGNSTR